MRLIAFTLFLAASVSAQMFPFPGPGLPVSSTPITYDTGLNLGYSVGNLTKSYNNSGNFLICGAYHDLVGEPALTWNGSALTQVGTGVLVSVGNYLSVFLIKNAATGTHNIVVTYATQTITVCSSLFGTNTASQPDNSATFSGTFPGNNAIPNLLPLTTVASSTWLFAFAMVPGGTATTAGASTVLEVTGDFLAIFIFDAGATVAAGANNLDIRSNSAGVYGGIIVSVK